MRAPFVKEVLADGTAAVLVAACPDIRVSKDTGSIVLQTAGLALAEEIDVLYQHPSEGNFVALLDSAGSPVKFTATSASRFVLEHPGIYRVAKDATAAAVGVTKVVSRPGD